MTSVRKILTAVVVTCGPLVFVVLETAPRIRY
jgi:hypothetical protein